MSESHRVGRRVVSGFAAVALAFGMAAMGASAASAAPAVDIAIVPGSPLLPGSKVEYAGLMYFSADNGSDRVLYSFDGTTFTEVTGGGDPAPNEVRVGVVYDGKLFFSGFSEFSGSESVLYSWDGTDFEAIPGSPLGVDNFIVFGGELIFRAFNSNDRVWFSWDGTAFTELAGGDPAPTSGFDPAEYAGKLYFTGSNGSDYVLYSWDGVAFDEISGGGDPAPTGVRTLYVFDGVLYMRAFNGVDDIMYSWNGTDFTDLAGVAPVNRSRFITFNGDLYFRANDGSDDFLHRFNGTTFTKVIGGTGSAPVPADPEEFVVYDGVLYFNADAVGSTSDTLHSWDGTNFTEYPAPPRDAEDPIVYNGVLYFSAEDTLNGGTEFMFSLRAAEAPELADTGADLGLPLGIAGAALFGGVIALAAARRRGVAEA